LKYWDNMPVLRNATMLSKPTKRIWLTSSDFAGLTRGFAAAKGQVKPLTQVGECMAVSTDRGVMEVREAAERKVGGMVLCRVW
jgi:ribosomal protein S8